MKRFILSTVLLSVFTATCTYAGTPKFGEGQRIQSHLLKVSSYAIPMVIDWNHDGAKDLIIGDEKGYVWFYQNFGSDNFPEFLMGTEIKVSNIPINVISHAAPYVVNWDNDKDLDLIVGNGNGQLTLFLSSNDLLFSPGSLPVLQPGVTITGINSHPHTAPFIYDWNDDGLKDLIIGDANGYIWVYLNKGNDSNPFFNEGYRVLGTGSVPLSVGNDAVPRVVQQWDGEGNKDLVVGNSEGEIYVFLSGTKTSNGTPTFTTDKKIQASNKNIDVGDNAAPFVIDWDKDERIDLVVGEKDGSLNLFKNTGNKPPELIISPKIAGEPSDLYAGGRIIPDVIDFDNDGKKDIIVGEQYGRVKLYLNTGTNQEPVFTDGYFFQEKIGTPTTIKDLDVDNNASPYVYDWNGDKIKDLIVGNEGGFIYIYINSNTDTSPIFNQGTKATTGTGTNMPLKVTYDATPIICDWNNDGNMDIVAGERNGYVNLFLNSGTKQKPIFVSSQRIKANGNDIQVEMNAKPFVEDFNNDGKKDLIIGNKNGYLEVYLNTGSSDTPIFTTQQLYHFRVQANSTELKVSGGYAAPVIVDWDEDTIYDLIVGEKDGYINLYTGTIENSPPAVIAETPIGTQSNNVTINYILKDDERNVCSIVVQYSTDFGNKWTTATSVLNAGDGVSNLNSSKDGIRHSFVWNSYSDLGQKIEKVKIKIIPHDSKAEGNLGESGEFGVDNVNPPKWKRIKLNGADLNLDSYSTPIVVDWDEDGRQDLLIGSEDGYVYFCKNIGSDEFPQFNGAYQLEVEGNSLKVNNYSSPYVYNWNSTGSKDLLVGDNDGYVTFFENIGSPQSLSQGKKIKVGANDLKVPCNATPIVVDWNNDGYKDLIVGDKNGNVFLYLNKNISPQPDTSPLLSEGIKIQANSDLDVGFYATPYVVDLKKDLIIGNSDGYVFYYKNIGSNGTPSFSSGVKIKFKGEDIKVNANSRPYVMKYKDNDMDLIVGSKAGYVFLYPLTQVDMNTPPQLTITNPKGTQSLQVGSVAITYILKDDNYNRCNIKVEYSENGQYWYSATGTPKTNLDSSPEGIIYTFIWFSKEDITATKTYIYLRFIPNDGLVDGATATVSFYLRNKNNLPMVSNVVANPTGKLGQVEISYDLQDLDNDSCQVLVEYQGGSVGSKWTTATVVGTTTGILPVGRKTLIWLSGVDEKNQSANDYKIKVTPFDIEYGTSGISTSFELKNSSISSAIIPKGTTTTVSFSPTTIEILKPFSNDFDVLITVEKNPEGIPLMNTLASLNNTVRKITTTWLPDNPKRPAPQTKANITIDYTDLGSYENEILLQIFELRENKWILVGGTSDVVKNRVTAEVEHFSVFRIGLHAPTLNNFSVSPNPFKDNDGIKENGELGAGDNSEVITFQGVTKVEIYTIAGELVRESKENEVSAGVWLWDLKNDYGRLVGSGIYIYVVKDSTGASLVGKLGVIR